ncbi:OOP family OmpA-OmpF porin [Inhella inkyongensis]|uniref:OOP family OmpA-OmpF porin n=1 Tax=Inhella inkyongensis TaxID=392593 RepID=A0A840S6N5_9BURK|nr:OmpA family protein [Inhella inkyongensis]MBB5204130.1 OOP family OmpA-OmpF porin [Inhella inkyongensis]
MNKLTRVASLLALAALTHTGAQAQVNDNWMDASGKLVWLNGTSEHCWRNASWTPATAAKQVANLKGMKGFAGDSCDGALLPPPPAPPAPPKAVEAPKPVVAPVAPPAPPKPIIEKVTYAADAFFDVDKAVLKPEAKTKLDDLASKMGAINLEVIIAVGHTDSDGSDEYNQKLSVRRAEAVKAYLTGKGIEANRVYTEGKGEKSPVADNKTREGKAKNRRVEIEVVGTRTVAPKK